MPQRTTLPSNYTKNNWKYVGDSQQNAKNGDALFYFECLLCHRQYAVRPYTVKTGMSKQCTDCGRAIGVIKRCKPHEQKTFLTKTVEGHSLSRDELMKYRAYSLYRHAFNSKSTKAGLPFDLTVDWILHKLQTGTCEVTGIPFVLTENSKGRGKGQTRPNKYAPSLDRKVPHHGYTTNNVQVVVWMYNMMKSVYSDADVTDFLQQLRGQNASTNL